VEQGSPVLSTIGMMEQNNKAADLSFGSIIHLDPGIYELIADADTEINAGHIRELIDFLQKRPVTERVGILVNRKHSYHYAFAAMQKFGSIDLIRGIAVLAENRESYARSKTIVDSFSSISPKKRKIKLFRDRKMALEWLKELIEGTSS